LFPLQPYLDIVRQELCQNLPINYNNLFHEALQEANVQPGNRLQDLEIYKIGLDGLTDAHYKKILISIVKRLVSPALGE
jgi:hypothetical protein